MSNNQKIILIFVVIALAIFHILRWEFYVVGNEIYRCRPLTGVIEKPEIFH